MGASSSGFVIEDSRLRRITIDGANSWTLQRNVLDGECEVAQNAIFDAKDWKILRNTARNYHVCADESSHSEAFYIGSVLTAV